MTYLGTNCSPEEYYKSHSHDYTNPHAGGIQYVLDRHKHVLRGSILDMGCGDGLITKLLPQHYIVGVDAEEEMISRYESETGHKGYVCKFWDELPKADSAIFSYSLHLCPNSRREAVGFRLQIAGVKTILVISPFKGRSNEEWCSFALREQTADQVGPDKKTIYGRYYSCING